MALIGKIREKSWLILIIVGGALLAFIMGDWQKISGGGEPKFGFGTVYGEKVSIEDYNAAYAIADLNADRAAQQQQQPKQPVDQAAVWNSFIQDLLLNKEYEALGINVGPAEFDAYLYGTDGFEVMPDLAQGFTDSTTGLFNAKLLQARIEEMKSSEDAEIKKQWEESEKYYVEKRKREKYFAILEQGAYVTNLEAKEDYLAQKEVKSVSYVLKRYSEIKNEEFNTSDVKLKAYFEANKDKKKYENRFSTREVRYIDISIEPSKADSMKFNKLTSSLKAGLPAAKNDSIFVMKNSDLKFYTSSAYSTAVPENHANAKQHLTYPTYMDTVFKKANIGDIYGPYDHQGVTNIVKVIGFTRDTINARHILLPVAEGKEAEVEARADSILKVINNGNFVEFVKKYSTDEGSKAKDGELGDFFFSQMVQPFAIYCADKPIGEIGKVRSQFGFHIIEVLDRKGPNHPRLAVVQKTLKASVETTDMIEKGVYDLLYKLDAKLSAKTDVYAKVDLFDTIVSKAGYFARPVNIQDNAPKLYGFTSKLAEDKILALAFNEEAKVGDIVNSPIKDDNRYVLAVVSAIKVKGEVKFEDVKLIVKNDYLNDMKAKRLTSQMAGKSLSQLAKGSNNQIATAEVTFATPQLTGAGFEPEIIGSLFSGLKDGQLTKPIQGKQGVYVLRVDKTLKAPAASNYDVEKGQLLGAAKGKISGEASKALIEKADVIDNRRFFETGIRR